MQDEFEPILRTVDLMATERAELSMSGPRFLILHRLWQPETLCTPGEAIAEIRLLHRTKEVSLPVSLRLMVLFDYLARHRRMPQCAAQIATGLTAARPKFYDPEPRPILYFDTIALGISYLNLALEDNQKSIVGD